MLLSATISLSRPTAPFVSGGDSVFVLPTGGASGWARKLAETNGDLTTEVLCVFASGAGKGGGTVKRTFGSSFSCGSGGSDSVSCSAGSRASARRSTTAAATT